MAKIGVLYGMEDSFPPALVDRSTSMRGGMWGVTAEHLQIGGVHMAEPSRLRRHRRPHLARHSVLSRLSEERRADRHHRHQQSVLVERRRQVLQLRAGLEARRRRAAAPCCCRTSSIRPAPPTQSMRNLIYPLNWDEHLRLHRIPGVSEAARRRRLEERLQGRHARRAFRRLRRDRRPLHDPARSASTSRNIFAATWSVRRRSTSCATIRGQPHHLRYVPGNPPPVAGDGRAHGRAIA